MTVTSAPRPTRPAETRPRARRLEEVMSLLPCPVSGCWFVNGAETSYYHDEDCECYRQRPRFDQECSESGEGG